MTYVNQWPNETGSVSLLTISTLKQWEAAAYYCAFGKMQSWSAIHKNVEPRDVALEEGCGRYILQDQLTVGATHLLLYNNMRIR